MAGNKFNSKTPILSYYNENNWNNSHIRVGDETVIFKHRYQSGIKYIKDIFYQNEHAIFL